MQRSQFRKGPTRCALRDRASVREMARHAQTTSILVHRWLDQSSCHQCEQLQKLLFPYDEFHPVFRIVSESYRFVQVSYFQTSAQIENLTIWNPVNRSGIKRV